MQPYCLFIFLKRGVALFKVGWSGIHHVNQSGLKLIDICLTFLSECQIKGMYHHSQPFFKKVLLHVFNYVRAVPQCICELVKVRRHVVEVRSLHHVGPGNWIQVVRLGSILSLFSLNCAVAFIIGILFILPNTNTLLLIEHGTQDPLHSSSEPLHANSMSLV